MVDTIGQRAFGRVFGSMLDWRGEERLVPPQSDRSARRRRGGVALVGVIGGYVGLCIGLGLGIGWLLDVALHTLPLFLISGVVIGFAASFYLIYRLAMGELVD
jgi:F0F1-type ATP synthase assembly protein I